MSSFMARRAASSPLIAKITEAATISPLAFLCLMFLRWPSHLMDMGMSSHVFSAMISALGTEGTLFRVPLQRDAVDLDPLPVLIGHDARDTGALSDGSSDDNVLVLKECLRRAHGRGEARDVSSVVDAQGREPDETRNSRLPHGPVGRRDDLVRLASAVVVRHVGQLAVRREDDLALVQR